jgi:hypothetical protein
MGFRLDRRYILRFEDTDLAGAEVIIRSTPISIADELVADIAEDRLYELFGQYIQSWNLEYEPTPGSDVWEIIPITPESIRAHMESALIRAIRREWLRAAMGITAPLGVRLSDGQESPDSESMELSIPMEPLSSNREN